MSTREPVPTWTFLERFRIPKEAGSISWASVRFWQEAADDSLKRVEPELQRLSGEWREALSPLGEISEVDWRLFRALPLERELAWSDWLAHLIERSETGEFARRLFGGHPDLPVTVGQPTVRREVLTGDGTRIADLLIEWKVAVAHVEVKVGDSSFVKTFDTAEKLLRDERAEHGALRAWVDFILLPPSDLDRWLDIAEKHRGSRAEIKPLTWRDVAVALRAVLRNAKESLPWRAWAHSFCGAVEQRLLGCEPASTLGSRARAPLARLAAASIQIDIMKEAMK